MFIKILHQVTSFIIKNSSILFVIAISSGLFFYSYWKDVARPGVIYEQGWYQVWADQGQYFIMAKKIYLKDFSPSGYSYPLGYPLLGALSYKLYPQDPFLIPDFLLFVGSISLLFLSIKNIVNKRTALMSVIMALVATPLLNICTIPWTTNVTLLSSTFALYAVSRKFSFNINLILGFLVGYAFFTRYADGIILFPFLISNSLRPLTNSSQNKINLFTIIKKSLPIILCGFIILTTFYVNILMFKNPLGSYLNTIQSVGVDTIQNWPTKLIGIFFNPFLYNKDYHILSIPLFSSLLLLLFSPLGFINLYKDKKTIMFSGLGSLLLWLSLYLPYTGFSPGGIKYGNIHYLKSILPIFILTSCLGINFSTENKNNFKALIYILVLAPLLVICIYLTPKEISKKNYTVKTSINTSTINNAIDNNLSTRWDTGRPQKTGDQVVIEIKKSTKITGITINAGEPTTANGCPDNLLIESSDNESDWAVLVDYNTLQGSCTNITRFFNKISAKYIRLKLESDNKTNWWVINEIYLYD